MASDTPKANFRKGQTAGPRWGDSILSDVLLCPARSASASASGGVGSCGGPHGALRGDGPGGPQARGGRSGGSASIEEADSRALAGAVCGNRRVEADELCDDGNQDDGDGCSFDCLEVESGLVLSALVERRGRPVQA